MKRRALIIHSEDRKENSDRLLQVANGKRKFLYYHLQEPLSRDDDMAIIHKDIMSGIVLDAYFSHESLQIFMVFRRFTFVITVAMKIL